MKTKTLKSDVCIIGGGMAGLSLACLLGYAGITCTVIDAEDHTTPQKPSGRTVALMDGSIKVLKSIGVWDDVKTGSNPLNILRIIDDSGAHVTPIQIDFKPQDIGLNEFGFNIPLHVLKPALVRRAMACPNITLLSPCKPVDIQTHSSHVNITTNDGRVILSTILVGTDGRKSIVREIMGIHITEKSYGQTAITCLISHTRDHQNISTEHHRTGGPFTYVPLPNYQSSIVWVEKTADAEKFIRLKKDEFERALEQRSLGALGTITLHGAVESWPLITLQAEKLISPRTALAGETAHVFSPMGAQGLNLSLRDIAVLAEIIVDAARLGEDIGADMVLRRYQTRRVSDIDLRIKGVNGLNDMVSNNIGFLRGLRRAGLTALNTLPRLRQSLMKKGLAPLLDDSRLLRGEVL